MRTSTSAKLLTLNPLTRCVRSRRTRGTRAENSAAVADQAPPAEPPGEEWLDA